MKKLFFTLCRLIFGGVFIYASLDKILHPGLFQEAVMNYRILPDTLTAAAALGLPWLEFICGVCLVLNWLPKGASLILNFLMVVFLAALAWNLYRGMDIHCGCFTTDPTADGNMMTSLVRDIGIFVVGILAMIGTFSGKPKRELAGWTG